MPRATTDTRIGIPSAVMYSTGPSGIAGIGISGATGMPFANGTVLLRVTRGGRRERHGRERDAACGVHAIRFSVRVPGKSTESLAQSPDCNKRGVLAR